MEPLLEFIRTVLEEGKFNFAKFEAIRNFKARELFLRDAKLKRLGCGSSRCAYVLSSRFALKAAMNKKGIGQNNAETQIWTDPNTKPIISNIQDFANDYTWLVAELVRPVHNPDEFEKLSGVSWLDAMAVVNGFDFNEWNDEVDDDFKDTEDDDSIDIQIDEPVSNVDDLLKQYKGKAQDFIQALHSFMKTSRLMPADINNIGHWGKTADGRVVILDYGFTDQVAQRFYAQGRYG